VNNAAAGLVLGLSIPTFAVLISFGSLFVAAISLGWNIYRDVIRKPRLRVVLMNAVITAGEQDPPRRITVSITNFGPTNTRACSLDLRKTSFWRRLFRRQKFAFLLQDYLDPLSGKIPCELGVGEKVIMTFRHLPDMFLESDYNQLGVIDPFGRMHWCSMRNYREVRESYLKGKKIESGGGLA
jgi:hypothetical protein